MASQVNTGVVKVIFHSVKETIFRVSMCTRPAANGNMSLETSVTILVSTGYCGYGGQI